MPCRAVPYDPLHCNSDANHGRSSAIAVAATAGIVTVYRQCSRTPVCVIPLTAQWPSLLMLSSLFGAKCTCEVLQRGITPPYMCTAYKHHSSIHTRHNLFRLQMLCSVCGSENEDYVSNTTVDQSLNKPAATQKGVGYRRDTAMMVRSGLKCVCIYTKPVV